jgi:hypothetical protein
MSRLRSSPSRDRIDPVVVHTRREALVILAAFVVFLTWSVSWCYLAGYRQPADPIANILGIPGWVFWGVVVPWLVADVFSLWFCFFFMADDPLQDAEDQVDVETDQPAQGRAEKEGGNA